MGVLPEKENVPVNGVPKHIKLVLEGKSKVGKTTFAASFPRTLMLECEPGGADFIKCHVLKLYLGKDPLEGLRQAIIELATDSRFDTVALDTVDALAELVSKEICRKHGISCIAEAPKKARKGVQWEEYGTGITGLVGALVALPKNVIILGHTKPATFDEDGKVKSEEGLDIYGKAARVVYARIDNIGHMSVINEGGVTKTMLSFRAGLDSTRGSRHPMLRDRELIVPKDNGYAAFEKLFTEVK